MAFRDSATFEADNTLGSTAISLTIPGTVQVGDVAVLVIAMNSTAATTLTATGWTQRVGQTTFGTAAYWVFTRTVQTGDTAIAITSSVARFFSVLCGWWSTPGLDVVGTTQSRPGSQSTTVALGTTSSSPSPQAVAIFVDKTTGLQGTPSLSKGTQRAFLESAGTNVNCSALLMDFAPGSTSTGDATATYAGTANANGAAVQLALLPTSATIPITASSTPTSTTALSLGLSRPLTATSAATSSAILLVVRSIPLALPSAFNAASTLTVGLSRTLALSVIPAAAAALMVIVERPLTLTSLALALPLTDLGLSGPLNLPSTTSSDPVLALGTALSLSVPVTALCLTALSLGTSHTLPLVLAVSAHADSRLRLPGGVSGVSEPLVLSAATVSLTESSATITMEGAPTYGRTW